VQRKVYGIDTKVWDAPRANRMQVGAVQAVAPGKASKVLSAVPPRNHVQGRSAHFFNTRP